MILVTLKIAQIYSCTSLVYTSARVSGNSRYATASEGFFKDRVHTYTSLYMYVVAIGFMQTKEPGLLFEVS